MKIYLVRHGAAVSPGDGVSDAHRFLTRAGRDTCRAVGRVLREQGVAVDAILTSPLIRAVQTAEILADAIDYVGEIASHVAFTPGVQARVTAQALLARGSAVMVVGHEPCMSDLAAFLVGQPGFAPFRTGEVFYFDKRQPIWRLHPEALQLQDLFIP